MVDTSGKPKLVEFNGTTYRLLSGGRYYLGQSKSNAGRKGQKGLHVAIWEHHNRRKVPEKHHIHHKDRDTFNNTIENLECMEASVHYRQSKKFNPEHFVHLSKIRINAAKWHGTEEGIEWHRKNGIKTWAKREKKKASCNNCKMEYSSYFPRGFCSVRCQSESYRRRKGVPNREEYQSRRNEANRIKKCG